jgi:hypothetical protein
MMMVMLGEEEEKVCRNGKEGAIESEVKQNQEKNEQTATTCDLHAYSIPMPSSC